MINNSTHSYIFGSRGICTWDKHNITYRQGCFLAMHAEKAFHTLAWHYMSAVLESIGMPGPYLKTNECLLHDTYGLSLYQGCRSDVFPISNGTQQGCPLFPLLYILRLERILYRLRKNPSIKGITVRKREYKLAAFSDDIIMFLTEPLISISS